MRTYLNDIKCCVKNEKLLEKVEVVKLYSLLYQPEVLFSRMLLLGSN
jgi:hypothetical protein